MADKVSACRDFTSSTTDIPRILSNYKAQSLPTRALLPSPLAATSLSARFIRRKKNMLHGMHCIQKEPFSSFTSKDEKGSRGTTLVDAFKVHSFVSCAWDSFCHKSRILHKAQASLKHPLVCSVSGAPVKAKTSTP